jgi:hypothetical protein
MTAIDFPNSPTLNQSFSASGRTWKWNGSAWTSVSSSNAIAISESAPSSPSIGDLWYNPTSGQPYIYHANTWKEFSPSTLNPLLTA